MKSSSTQSPGAVKVPSYFIDDVKFPFCRGCGHTSVLRHLNDALVELQLAPSDVALVTDIGCIGLSDGLFASVHTVHTTHGRSTAFATGIALADSLLAERQLKTIVLIGDGGAMIGLQHLVHAAMLNVDVTVLICNNFVYGMTGGQGSCFTPERFVTSTTPSGNMLPPADLCEILRRSHAPFVARATATDRDLPKILQEGIAFPGFAAIEILELCTEFAVPANDLTGRKLMEVAENNHWKLGILESRNDRPMFADRYERGNGSQDPRTRGLRSERPRPVAVRHSVSIVVAGSAGEGVQSASALLCQAALEGNLYVTQKNDNPVTQGSGFSLSELWLSPKPIGFTGIEHPDILVVASDEGLRELRAQGWLERIGPNTRVVVDETIDFSPNGKRIFQLPLRSVFGARSAALGGLAWICSKEGIIDPGGLLDLAADRFGPNLADRVLEGLEKLRRAGGTTE